MRALQLVVAALTASSFAQFALAQNTPSDGASPAGSGGANNPALIGEVPDGPAPRLPDGTPDFTGVWVGGGPVGDISEGLLPGEEIVLLPAAKALMDSRMAADDPEARCLPTGVPRVAPYPWRIVQTPSHGKATHLFFLFEGNIHSFRQIFMDGRKHPDDLEATWYGHSVGHWEGDTLVIETVGFNELFWFDFVGASAHDAAAHGRALHAHEVRRARERHDGLRRRCLREAVHDQAHGHAASRLGADGIHLQREQPGRRAHHGPGRTLTSARRFMLSDR